MLAQIITLEKIEWSGEATSVTLPTTDGQITILPGHRKLICAVEAGEVNIKTKQDSLSFFITEGCAEITETEVSVLADLATKAADLTLARVEEAKKAAATAKLEKIDDVEFASIESNLRRELAKEKIIQKYKIKTRPII
jgi:F-type H+-transporting ATPase subunit epsilon